MVAELAVTDGMPPPGDLPCGECIMTRLPDGRVRIDHADPRILISGELLGIWHDGDGSPEVALRCVCEDCPDSDDLALHCPNGDVVTLRAANRTVIYRIGEYVPRVDGYIAEWPD